MFKAIEIIASIPPIRPIQKDNFPILPDLRKSSLTGPMISRRIESILLSIELTSVSWRRSLSIRFLKRSALRTGLELTKFWISFMIARTFELMGKASPVSSSNGSVDMIRCKITSAARGRGSSS